MPEWKPVSRADVSVETSFHAAAGQNPNWNYLLKLRSGQNISNKVAQLGFGTPTYIIDPLGQNPSHLELSPLYRKDTFVPLINLQFLRNANSDLFNPLVPKAHNSEY